MSGPINALSAGATGDGSTPDQDAINAAIAAAQAAGGGQVYLPKPSVNYLLTAPIQLLPGVSLSGDIGTGSEIVARDTNAIELRYQSLTGGSYVGNYVQGFGNTGISSLYIKGLNQTASRIAINQPGSLDYVQGIVYGLTLRDLIVDTFDVAIAARSSNFVTVQNVWGQNINQGLNLAGANYNWSVGGGTKFVKANGAGSWGTAEAAVYSAPFNFSVRGGNLNPEGIQFNQFWTNGFANSFFVLGCGFLTVKNSNLQSSAGTFVTFNIYGGFYVDTTYMEIGLASGSSAIMSILDPGGPVGNESIVIDKCTLVSGNSGPSAFVSGIYVAPNHANVMIHRTKFYDLQNGSGGSYDIDIAAPNQLSIRDCMSQSSFPMASGILLGSCIGGVNNVVGNNMKGALSFNPADVASGLLAHSRNVCAGVRD
jgi:hypothetical protein